MKFDEKRSSLKKEFIQILLIFFLGGFLQELIFDPGDLSTLKSAIESVALNGCFWVALWKGSEYLVFVIQRSGLLWVDQPLKTFVVAFTSVVVYTIGVIFIILAVYMMGYKGMDIPTFLNSLRLWYFLPALFITIGINTFMHGRAFLLHWREAAVEMEKFRNESLRAQYESLKNQVNPHFLFNSLNVLSSLVYDDQEKAVAFIRKLSQVYRYVLDKKDMELVPLEDELKFLENYVFLQKIRFGDNLKVDIHANSKSGFLPPIALQLLVENAIKHNVVSEQRPLQIDITIDSETCTVRNNIQEKLEKDSTGIGLSNLKERYEYLSDRKLGINQTETIFEVKLPVLKSGI